MLETLSNGKLMASCDRPRCQAFFIATREELAIVGWAEEQRTDREAAWLCPNHRTRTSERRLRIVRS